MKWIDARNSFHFHFPCSSTPKGDERQPWNIAGAGSASLCRTMGFQLWSIVCAAKTVWIVFMRGASSFVRICIAIKYFKMENLSIWCCISWIKISLTVNRMKVLHNIRFVWHERPMMMNDADRLSPNTDSTDWTMADTHTHTHTSCTWMRTIFIHNEEEEKK